MLRVGKDNAGELAVKKKKTILKHCRNGESRLTHLAMTSNAAAARIMGSLVDEAPQLIRFPTPTEIRGIHERRSNATWAPGCDPRLLTQKMMNSAMFQAMAKANYSQSQH
jgi:hypothetical protein